MCQGFLPDSPLLLMSFLNLITRKSINIIELPVYIMEKSAYHKDTTHASANF